MPIGLVAFEILSSLGHQSKNTSVLLRKHLKIVTRIRPKLGTVLLTVVTVYLVCSRLGPVLTRVGESAYETFELEQTLQQGLAREGLQTAREAYKRFRDATRVPGPLARRSAYGVLIIIMGSSCSRGESDNELPKLPVRKPSDGDVKVKRVEYLSSIRLPDETEHHVAVHEKVEEAVHETKPVSTNGVSKDPRPSISSVDDDKKPVKFHKIEGRIKSGDLAVLYREGQEIPHFAIFVDNSKCDPNFPLLLVKGRTKPLPYDKFKPWSGREAKPVSAVTRIFYGDYWKVAVRHVEVPAGKEFYCHELMEYINQVQNTPFTDEELEAIEKANTPQERSARVCTFMVAHFYKLVGLFNGDPSRVTPETLEEHINLADPIYIKLPPPRPGPVVSGDPPLLSKLVEGIRPPSEITTVPYSSVIDSLNTGDLVLFSGATSSGAIIKFFDNSQFSHVGLVLKAKYTTQLLIWEASTNKAGLVDIESGKVRRGVELVPLGLKMFSGWYDRVAVRRLTEVDDKQRREMYEQLLLFRKEVQGRPYEKNKIELILSSIDAQEKYLSFLRNTHEDLSSLFCSELVAEAYKRMGILNTNKFSNEFTPDDFSSARGSELELNFGKLEPEVYIELKFDFGLSRQISAY